VASSNTANALKAIKPSPAQSKSRKVEESDKPKIAPAPLRPALKVAKRAEANRDKNQKFKVDTNIIYPAHGVGYITEIEKQEIAGIEIELFVIEFEHEKMKLRVPVAKAAAAGMRNLAPAKKIDEMMKLIQGKPRIKRTMWSRRAQEYEAKINSGDLQAVCEVVRDLFRPSDQPEQSYSERQLFEQARERFGREVAAVRKKTLDEAVEEIMANLEKRAKAEA
jgi:CarD family transcriptional regulator